MTIEIEGYEDVTPLGRGGFSTVYRARQVEFDRWVAVKVLDVGLDQRQREAFERECRAMGVVSQHPNIVTVLSAAFTGGGQPAIVMELYGGGTFADRVKRSGPIPGAEVLEVGVRISGALQSAHDRGLLHRDVKPHNLFVSDYGEPALGDFGISSFADDEAASSGLTVHYAAPEIIEHQRASASSDVYALAVTLYTLVAGRRPFAIPGERQRVADVALRILREPPPRIGGSCPPQLERAILQGMAKQPEDRPASAASFGRLLQAAQEGLGAGRTELAVARVQGDGSDLTVPREPPGGGFDDDESATLARPVAAGSDRREPEVDPRPPTSGRRTAVSVAAGVVAVGMLVGGGIWAAQRDGEVESAADTDAASAEPAAPDDDLFVRVQPPEDVRVRRASDGQVRANWRATEGLRYEVERVDDGSTGTWTTEDDAVVLNGLEPDDSPCVVVRAISDRGQLSSDSAPVCLGD